MMMMIFDMVNQRQGQVKMKMIGKMEEEAAACVQTQAS